MGHRTDATDNGPTAPAPRHATYLGMPHYGQLDTDTAAEHSLVGRIPLRAVYPWMLMS